MRGRIGSLAGAYSTPDSINARGAWRLSEVYAAKQGAYGSPVWPTGTLTLGWQSWPPGIFDATATGSATPTYVVTGVFGGLASWSHFWQKSTNGGSTWSNVPGSSGADAYTIFLPLTGQTAANDGDRYRAVVSFGLRQIIGADGVLRFDPAVSISWSQHPQSVSTTNGSWTYIQANASAVGQTYGSWYTPSFRWQISVDGGATWADDPGQTQSYFYRPVTLSDNGARLRVVASAGGQTSISEVAILTVT